MLDLLFSGQDDNFQGNKLLPAIKQHLRANKQHLDLIWVIYSSCLGSSLGKRSKNPITALCRDGGGVPPLAVIFFPLTFWPVACRDGGGGTPPCRD